MTDATQVILTITKVRDGVLIEGLREGILRLSGKKAAQQFEEVSADWRLWPYVLVRRGREKATDTYLYSVEYVGGEWGT